MPPPLSKAFFFKAAPEDLIRWKADAQRRNMSLSQWIRFCLNEVAGRNTELMSERQHHIREPEVPIEEPARTVEEPTAAPSLGRLSTLQSPPAGYARMRDTAKELAARSGKCTADVARGTRCKLCGKIH